MIFKYKPLFVREVVTGTKLDYIFANCTKKR